MLWLTGEIMMVWPGQRSQQVYWGLIIRLRQGSFLIGPSQNLAGHQQSFPVGTEFPDEKLTNYPNTGTGGWRGGRQLTSYTQECSQWVDKCHKCVTAMMSCSRNLRYKWFIVNKLFQIWINNMTKVGSNLLTENEKFHYSKILGLTCWVIRRL